MEILELIKNLKEDNINNLIEDKLDYFNKINPNADSYELAMHFFFEGLNYFRTKLEEIKENIAEDSFLAYFLDIR